MKMFEKFFMAAMMVATVGFAGCSKDDDKKSSDNPAPEPDEYAESATFAINYEGNAVAAGQTVTYTHTTGLPKVDFEIVNKTQEPKDAYFKVELMEGLEVMKNIGFCLDVCADYTCPFTTSSAYTVPAGGKKAFDMQFLNGAEAGTTALYRMTAGKGRNLEDPQVIFVRITI